MSLEEGLLPNDGIARMYDAEEDLDERRSMRPDSLLDLCESTDFIVRDAYIGVGGGEEVVSFRDRA
jgi:hypothetical protein